MLFSAYYYFDNAVHAITSKLPKPTIQTYIALLHILHLKCRNLTQRLQHIWDSQWELKEKKVHYSRIMETNEDDNDDDCDDEDVDVLGLRMINCMWAAAQGIFVRSLSWSKEARAILCIHKPISTLFISTIYLYLRFYLNHDYIIQCSHNHAYNHISISTISLDYLCRR